MNKDKNLSDLMGETYESVRRMIWGIVLQYQRRHGGDVEELMSVANLAFVEAVHTFDPNIAAFTTHVHNQVRFALLNEATALHKGGGFAKRTINKSLNQETELEDFLKRSNPELVAGKNRFDLVQLMSEISQEAKEVILVALTLDPKKEAINLSTLSSILSEAGRWSAAEILKVFKELKEVFSG